MTRQTGLSRHLSRPRMEPCDPITCELGVPLSGQCLRRAPPKCSLFPWGLGDTQEDCRSREERAAAGWGAGERPRPLRLWRLPGPAHLPLRGSLFLAHEGTRTRLTGPCPVPRLPQASTNPPSPESPGECHLPSRPPSFQRDRGLRNAGMVLEDSSVPSGPGYVNTGGRRAPALNKPSFILT